MRDIRKSEIGQWALRSFRPAAEASAGRILAYTLGQSLVFWLAFLVLIPLGLAEFERRFLFGLFRFPTQSWSPWIAFALAGCVGLSSGATMAIAGKGTPLPTAAPRRLVVAGPYRYIRNPMAVAGLLQGACVGAALGSSLTFTYVVVGGLLWNTFVRPLEELDLEQRFGDDFTHYQSQIRCWIPRARPYHVTR